ncbi:site-2 protease family protein [Lipingzhangella sp. LS1_29]|uniref:Site-2 protease family protein n=1 Tax=Lipingzhangella rawalii TaxID=2055835 RepID=A0ABU2HB37_9ACTN|nr:site-2 protease family protein [Lipingzhangella rawalii]MDS1272496.1 site-2 protease family protein [Lipingzhangella rawalii]
MLAVLTTIGIVLFVLGLLFSIAWHELGHLAFAKLFNIRCTQYMVGVGTTLWSRTWGETEYGIKAVPIAGYVRMVGMIPPARRDESSSGTRMSRWRAMIEDAREAHLVEVEPGDEDRMFYQRKPWKRILVMVGGPVMNLILALVLFASVLMGIGLQQETTTVGVVNECVVAVDESQEECPEDAAPTPAAEAGMYPGDEIVAVNGTPTPDWRSLQETIRDAAGPGTIEVVRDGATHTLDIEITRNEVAVLDEDGTPVQRTDADGEPVTDAEDRVLVETEEAGFIGIQPAYERSPLSAGETAAHMADTAYQVGEHLILLPTKIPDLWNATFAGAERQPDSPVGVVGASRIGGEILTLDMPIVDRGAVMLMMLATVNLFLFALNMLPLLPLDGGHIFGALWESVRRHLARLFRRPDPGPFDTAKLMPVAYVVILAFVGLSVLLLIADIVNPVRLVQ